MGKNISKNVSQNLSDMHIHKLLDHGKQTATGFGNCFKNSNLKNSKSD